MPETILKQPSIYEYPKDIHHLLPPNSITLGDAHGNTCKILYLLIQQGILTMEEIDYKIFVWIYSKRSYWQPIPSSIEDDLNTADLHNLQTVIAAIQLTPAAAGIKVRLIGDELSDRGNNDYFTILLLKHLIDLGIDIEFMMSNHGAEFLYHYYFKRHSKTFKSSFNYSQQALIRLIKKHRVTQDDIDRFITQYYLPRLVSISYSVDLSTKSITLYSHAPISLALIEESATFLAIQYDDTTILALCHTIDQINLAVKQQLKTFIKNVRTNLSKDYPLYFFIENREVYTYQHHYSIETVFGHIGPGAIKDEKEDGIFNLDNYCGHPDAEQQYPDTLFDVSIHHSQQPSLALRNLQLRQTLSIASPDAESLAQAAEQWLAILTDQTFIFNTLPGGLALRDMIQSLMRQMLRTSNQFTEQTCLTHTQQLRDLMTHLCAYQSIDFSTSPVTQQRLITLLNALQETMQSLDTDTQLNYLTTRLPPIICYAQLTSLMMATTAIATHNTVQLLFTALQDLLQQTWLLPDGQSPEPHALLTMSDVLTNLTQPQLDIKSDAPVPEDTKSSLGTKVSNLIPPNLVSNSNCQAFISAITEYPPGHLPPLIHTALQIIQQAKTIYGQLPNKLYQQILEQTITLTNMPNSPRALQTYQSLIQQIDGDTVTQRFKKGIFIFMGFFAATVGVLATLSLTSIATLPIGGMLILAFIISISATAIAQKWLPHFPDRTDLANNMRLLPQKIQEIDETQSSASPHH
ncbi:MAG: hypothetical protein GKR77_02900 [Legionellales bacterium]|nr:hypothetical protein [Legionellales bacterium]